MLGDVWGERCWHHGSPFAEFGAQVWALFAELCPLPSLAGAVVGLGDGELLLLGNRARRAVGPDVSGGWLPTHQGLQDPPSRWQKLRPQPLVLIIWDQGGLSWVCPGGNGSVHRAQPPAAGVSAP